MPDSRIRIHAKIASLMGILGLLCTLTTLYAEPDIPQSDIPKDIDYEMQQTIGLLYSGYPSVREDACSRLSGKAQAMPFLLTMLDDCDSPSNEYTSYGWTRMRPGANAAEAVGAVGEPAVTPLLGMMKTPKTMERRHVIYALGCTGSKRVIGPLVKALDDRDAGVRGEAVKALAIMKNPIVAKHIVAVLKKDDYWGVRACACHALGELHVKSSLGTLLEALNDESSAVRKAAVYALGGFDDPRGRRALISILANRRSELRQPAAQALYRYGDDSAVDSLISVAKSDSETNARCSAISVLGKIHTPKATAYVLVALHDEDPGVRATAARTLADADGAKAEKYLIEMLRTDECGSVRYSAVEALSRISTPAATNALLSAATGDKDPRVQSCALGMLRVADSRFFELLISHLDDKDYSIRDTAIQRIIEMRDPRFIDVLSKRLSDDSPLIRIKAVRGLGLIEDPRVSTLMAKALGDSNISVRYEALNAISNMNEGDPAVIEALIVTLSDVSGELREGAHKELCSMTRQQLPAETAAWRAWWERSKADFGKTADGGSRRN